MHKKSENGTRIIKYKLDFLDLIPGSFILILIIDYERKMTNKIVDTGLIEAVGYGTRHGPSARGKPAVRGKPLFKVIQCKTGFCLQWNSRVLAAQKTDVQIGQNCLKWEWYVWKKVLMD